MELMIGKWGSAAWEERNHDVLKRIRTSIMADIFIIGFSLRNNPASPFSEVNYIFIQFLLTWVVYECSLQITSLSFLELNGLKHRVHDQRRIWGDTPRPLVTSDRRILSQTSSFSIKLIMQVRDVIYSAFFICNTKLVLEDTRLSSLCSLYCTRGRFDSYYLDRKIRRVGSTVNISHIPQQYSWLLKWTRDSYYCASLRK